MKSQKAASCHARPSEQAAQLRSCGRRQKVLLPPIQRLEQQ